MKSMEAMEEVTEEVTEPTEEATEATEEATEDTVEVMFILFPFLITRLTINRIHLLRTIILTPLRPTQVIINSNCNKPHIFLLTNPPFLPLILP